MTEQEWLSSNDPVAMLQWVVRGRGQYTPGKDISDRKLRLFACACARHAFQLLSRPKIAMSKASVLAINYAERFADDDQSEVLAECLRLARSEALSAFNLSGLFEDELAVNCSGGIADITCNSGLPRWFSVSNKHAAAQADLLRHIVGNPWHPLITAEKYLSDPFVHASVQYAARSGTPSRGEIRNRIKEAVFDRRSLAPLILDLARQVYGGDQTASPILHDALLDAGAPAELAEHFYPKKLTLWQQDRTHGWKVEKYSKAEADWADSLRRHPKGCWALDAILGLE